MKKIYQQIKNFTGNMRKENISAFAASSAFFIFLSFIPLMMLLCAAIPHTPMTQADLEGAISMVIPEAAMNYVSVIINDVYEQSKSLLPVAAVVLLWTAGKGILAVIRGLNAIHEVEEHRNYFVIRFIAMLYTVVFLIIILVGLGIMSFGNLIGEMLIRYVPTLDVILSLLPFRFVVFWAFLTIMFGMIYAFVPDKKLKIRNQLPGACLAAVAWSVLSFGFSIYLEYGNSFNIYGSLTILIVLMMWLYFCMYVVFIGAYLNQYFPQKGVL